MNINDKFEGWKTTFITVKDVGIKQFRKKLKNEKGYNQVILTIRINSKSLKIEYFLLSGHGKAHFISDFYNRYYNGHHLDDEIFDQQKVCDEVDKIISNCYSYLVFS